MAVTHFATMSTKLGKTMSTLSTLLQIATPNCNNVVNVVCAHEIKYNFYYFLYIYTKVNIIRARDQQCQQR